MKIALLSLFAASSGSLPFGAFGAFGASSGSLLSMPRGACAPNFHKLLTSLVALIYMLDARGAGNCALPHKPGRERACLFVG